MTKKELSEYMSKLGKKGAKAVLLKDPLHYQKLSVAGNKARWAKNLTNIYKNIAE